MLIIRCHNSPIGAGRRYPAEAVVPKFKQVSARRGLAAPNPGPGGYRYCMRDQRH